MIALRESRKSCGRRAGSCARVLGRFARFVRQLARQLFRRARSIFHPLKSKNFFQLIPWNLSRNAAESVWNGILNLRPRKAEARREIWSLKRWPKFIRESLAAMTA